MDLQIFLRQAWLLTSIELHRVLMTRRGWVVLGAFAIIWGLILAYPIALAAAQLQQAEVVLMLNQLLGFAGLQQVLRWPLPELVVFWWIGLVFFPFQVLMSAADQTCSDLQRGTLRFIVLRCSRSAIFFGRFFGQVLLQWGLISVALVATLAMAWYRQGAPSWSVVQAMGLILLNLCILILPLVAMLAVASMLAKSARLALCWSLVVWGGTAGLLQWAGASWPLLWSVQAWLPLAQLPELFAASGDATLPHLWLPLIQTLVLLAFGWWMIQRKAL